MQHRILCIDVVRAPPLLICLQIGDWEHAQELMRWLRSLGLSDFAAFPAVGRALCEWPAFRLPDRCPPCCGLCALPSAAASDALPMAMLMLPLLPPTHHLQVPSSVGSCNRCMPSPLLPQQPLPPLRTVLRGHPRPTCGCLQGCWSCWQWQGSTCITACQVGAGWGLCWGRAGSGSIACHPRVLPCVVQACSCCDCLPCSCRAVPQHNHWPCYRIC
jgi:hypothetical protein